MTLEKLTDLVRQEFDRRNLQKTRYYALKNVATYIQNYHGSDLQVLSLAKKDFKHLYKEYKTSINRKMSDAENSAINEIYNQFMSTSTTTPVITKSVPEEKKLTLPHNTKELMNQDNFKSVCDLSESTVPDSPGMYAIRIKNVNDIPNPFNNELTNRKHNLLYIGIASQSLRERLWKQELNHENPATFFRSIGAILGFRPIKGSLYGKESNNYKFNKEDTETIRNWIKEHLLVNFIIINEKLEDTEKILIKDHKPIINIKNNPYKMGEVSALRSECIKIAKDI